MKVYGEVKVFGVFLVQFRGKAMWAENKSSTFCVTEGMLHEISLTNSFILLIDLGFVIIIIYNFWSKPQEGSKDAQIMQSFTSCSFLTFELFSNKTWYHVSVLRIYTMLLHVESEYNTIRYNAIGSMRRNGFYSGWHVAQQDLSWRIWTVDFKRFRQKSSCTFAVGPDLHGWRSVMSSHVSTNCFPETEHESPSN